MAEARHNRSVPIQGLLLAWILLAASCKFEPGAAAAGDGGGPDGGRPIDAAIDPDGPPPIDGAQPDGPPPGGAAHLLITEVKTQPSSAEFIEIANLLSVEVPLRDYYLTDDRQYASLPQSERDGNEVNVGGFDAILRFPEGAVLMPGQVAVVAMDEVGFGAAFGGAAPDYALDLAPAPVAAAMEVIADASQSMEITDTGEAITLFRWDGLNDLVTDVDIVEIGDSPPAAGQENGVPDKTAVEVDGPDTDDTARSYAPDGATMPAMTFRSGNGGSYKRAALEGAAEPDTGSNGIAGHDETSEDTLTTWDQSDSAPTPGVVPAL